ncbi:hypothetical protein GOBAR_DD27470 [Gossypium barbadense]|nr:hypothetical protein GOBAR_DD27470 [Gossypium barbadense]
MRQCVKGHTRGLLYPHLITELCRRVGIEFDVDELICPPKGIRSGGAGKRTSSDTSGVHARSQISRAHGGPQPTPSKVGPSASRGTKSEALSNERGNTEEFDVENSTDY